MHLDDTVLLAYVDGDLPAERGDLARISGSARSRERRRPSPLWFAAAFAAGALLCWAILKLKTTR
jgi:hypothetical protein